MARRATVLTSCLFLLAALTLPSAAGAQPPQTSFVLSPEEFPELDWGLWYFEQRGLLNKRATEKVRSDPGRSETLDLLLQADRPDDAVRAFRAIVDKRPDELWRALALIAGNSDKLRREDDGSRARTVRELVVQARGQLNGLPREEEAKLARLLLNAEMQFSQAPGRDSRAALADFARQYAGTEAAGLTEVEMASGRVIESRKWGTSLNTDALERFVQEHPGTTVAAKALYEKGFHLAVNSGDARGTDPTDRLLAVLKIEQELESGRYPRSEWVDRAPSLITGFFAFEPTYSPANAQRAIAMYTRFVKTHFKLDGQMPTRNGIGYLVVSKIPEILKRSGKGPEAMEAVFADLEGDPVIGDGVRFLHGTYYGSRLNERLEAGERAASYRKARDLFAALAARGDDPIHRKGLATLAALQFKERDFAKARNAYRQYLDKYPGTDWSWVAALKIGRSEAALGNWKKAAEAYASAAARFPGLPPARVLGEAYAAEAYEALHDFAAALAANRRALAAWDDDFGPAYSLHETRLPAPNEPWVTLRDDAEIKKTAVADRIDNLAAALSHPGGTALAEGRWLLQNGRREEGIAALERVASLYSSSPAAREARELIHAGRLDEALDAADLQKPDSDRARAMKELQALGREPLDFPVFAAKLARAALLWVQGASQEAETIGLEAVDEWSAHQAATMPSTKMTPLEADVVEIRNLVFRPAGDGLFRGSSWSAWRGGRPSGAFSIVRARMSVKLASGEVTDVDVFRPIPGIESVLFLRADQLAFFDNLLAKVGGTERRQPAAIMETPNQPVGGSMNVLRFLNKFFPARPGHWGGWMFETFPTISRIEFTNEERTKATARFTIGYEGATVLLEKENGRWVAKGTVDRWIT